MVEMAKRKNKKVFSIVAYFRTLKFLKMISLEEFLKILEEFLRIIEEFFNNSPRRTLSPGK